jgi:hypothetical protein
LDADLAKAESSKAILQIRYYGQVEAISKEALAEYPENPPRAYLETVDQLTRKASADSTVLKSLNSNLLRMGVRGHELITVKNRVESDVIAATS